MGEIRTFARTRQSTRQLVLRHTKSPWTFWLGSPAIFVNCFGGDDGVITMLMRPFPFAGKFRRCRGCDADIATSKRAQMDPISCPPVLSRVCTFGVCCSRAFRESETALSPVVEPSKDVVSRDLSLTQDSRKHCLNDSAQFPSHCPSPTSSSLSANTLLD